MPGTSLYTRKRLSLASCDALSGICWALSCGDMCVDEMQTRTCVVWRCRFTPG